jgi:hypothetical protein
MDNSTSTAAIANVANRRAAGCCMARSWRSYWACRAQHCRHVGPGRANFLESYYVGLRRTEALAGAALVFPFVMPMQTMSAGGIGSGISLPWCLALR